MGINTRNHFGSALKTSRLIFSSWIRVMKSAKSRYDKANSLGSAVGGVSQKHRLVNPTASAQASNIRLRTFIMSLSKIKHSLPFQLFLTFQAMSSKSWL
jgi:hypothetical protein